MNKMNIPAPFRMALPTPPLPPEVPAPPPPVPPPHPSVTAKPQSAELSSDESEMESSDEVTCSLLPWDQTFGAHVSCLILCVIAYKAQIACRMLFLNVVFLVKYLSDLTMCLDCTFLLPQFEKILFEA